MPVADFIIAPLVWRFGSEQLPGPGDIGNAITGSKEPVVADAVLSFGEHVDHEPADELRRRQRHGRVTARALRR